MTQHDLFGLVQIMDIYDIYINELIQLWTIEYVDKITGYDSQTTYWSLALSFSIIFIHIVLIELIILRRISAEYQFFCKIYENLMP
jgi:hypothetical protein